MSKLKNKKRLTIVLIVFALVLVAGAVYASLQGTLEFEGTVTLAPEQEVKLEIVSMSTDEIVVSAGGQKATVTVELENPGDDLELYFQIDNTGDLPARITNVTPTAQAPLKLSGTYTQAASTRVITVGQSAVCNDNWPYFTLIVEWEDGVDDTAQGDYTFEIEIDYELAS